MFGQEGPWASLCEERHTHTAHRTPVTGRLIWRLSADLCTQWSERMNEMLHFSTALFFLVLKFSWKRALLEGKGTLLLIWIVMWEMWETLSRTDRTWWRTGSRGGPGEKEPVSSKVWGPEEEKGHKVSVILSITPRSPWSYKRSWDTALSQTNRSPLLRQTLRNNHTPPIKLRGAHLVENAHRWAGGGGVLNAVSRGARGCAPESERHTPHLQQGGGRRCEVWAQGAHTRSDATARVPVNQNCVCATRAFHSHWSPGTLLGPWTLRAL